MDRNDGDYIAEVHIDEATLPALTPEQQHERRVAVFDLLEDNLFRTLDAGSGPYKVDISLRDGTRLDFDISRTNGADRGRATIALVPLRRIIKDYFLICESYHNAIRTGTSQQIEAIDMGRRGLHNEGSRMVEDSLKAFAEFDFLTSRRLYTLICALHRRPTAGSSQ